MIIHRSALANALRVAAEQYDRDAISDNARIAMQFDRQAREARELADHIEQTAGFTITLRD